MIHSSPTGLPGYIRIKFWSNFIPLLLISEVLAAVSSLLLKSSILLLSVAVVDTFFLTMVIAAMSLYFGIIYVNFSAESFTRMPSGFGGMVFMIASMIFAGAILLLQSHAFWLYFRDGVGWGLSVAAISWKHYVYLATMIGLSGTICLKSTGAFLSAATARISYLEEGPQVDQS